MPAKLPKGPRACRAFDRSRDALRQEQPPRDEISIPGVHDRVDLLIEKIAGHGCDGWRRRDIALERLELSGANRPEEECRLVSHTGIIVALDGFGSSPSPFPNPKSLCVRRFACVRPREHRTG